MDNFGRVIGSADPLSAGAIAIEELTTSVVNYDKTAKFLIRPVQIASIDDNTTFSTRVSVFPTIRSLNFSGGALQSYTNTGFSLVQRKA